MKTAPEKVRIAYVVNDLLMGGAQMTVFALASKLDSRLYEPAVYYLNEYPKERTNLKQRFAAANVPVYYIGKGGKTTVLAAIRSLRRTFAASVPHLVHTHLVDATIAGVLAARLAGVSALIIHEHQTHRMYSLKVRALYRCIRPLARLTVCFSPVVEQELFGSQALLTDIPDRLVRRSYSIYNGIDTAAIEETIRETNPAAVRARFNLPIDSILITSVARFVKWKGQRSLLEAFKKVGSQKKEVYLCFVGEGHLEPELRARAEALEVSARVLFLGARTDVYEILAASDIGALALTYEKGMTGESIGIAGLEMMAAGLPLIASDYPGARAFIQNEETGILVPPGDSHALADALEMLVNDKEKRRRIGESGKVFVSETMSWSRIVPIYEKIYSLATRS